MKILKTLCASLTAAALAGAMATTAFASSTTWEDVVSAAENCGVQARNVQELSNFLEHADADNYFTSDDYDYMISVMQDVCDTYVVDLAYELFGKTPAELTEDEKVQLGKNWSIDDRTAIINALLELGEKYNVEIDVDALTGSYDSTANYTVAASYTLTTSGDDSSSSDSSSASSTSSTTTGTIVKTTDAVAATGTSEEASSDGGVVGIAAGLLALTTAGVIIVAKKNKS